MAHCNIRIVDDGGLVLDRMKRLTTKGLIKVGRINFEVLEDIVEEVPGNLHTMESISY